MTHSKESALPFQGNEGMAHKANTFRSEDEEHYKNKKMTSQPL